MKVTAYSTKTCEKEFIINANDKKHDIDFISTRLTTDTVSYAKGKDAVLVFPSDDLSSQVLQDLKQFGVKYIVTRSTGTDHIDLPEAKRLGLKIANIASYSPESIAEHAIMLILALCRNVLTAHQQMMDYDFTLDHLVGTTISSKTVGVVGFGQTGQAMVRILRGFGCQVLVSDKEKVAEQCLELDARQVSHDVLLKEADIISFHVPLTSNQAHG